MLEIDERLLPVHGLLPNECSPSRDVVTGVVLPPQTQIAVVSGDRRGRGQLFRVREAEGNVGGTQ